MPYFYWSVPLIRVRPAIWQQTCLPPPISQQWSLILELGSQSHPRILQLIGNLPVQPEPPPVVMQPAKTKSSFKMFLML